MREGVSSLMQPRHHVFNGLLYALPPTLLLWALIIWAVLALWWELAG